MAQETNNKAIAFQSKPEPETVIIEEKLTKPNGEVVIKRYARGKVLGKGGFAKCYEVTNMDTKKVSALKIVNKMTLKKSKAKQKLITEIKIHKLLNHKNVVLFDHVFEDSENVYIFLELCSRHTLNEMMKKRKRVTELETQYYLSQMIQGVSYLHASKVIHRDLKLGNLMIGDSMDIKIGDFGLAAKLEYNNEKKKTICGTPNYIAPEILEGKGHSYEVDIWSLGVIMYTLLYGRPPFETTDVKKTYKKIKQCQFIFNDQLPVSNNAKNLISKILVSDPSKRPTLEQILQHPFMTANKIPKPLPVVALSTPLNRQFIDQYVFYSGVNSIKKPSTSKGFDRSDFELEKSKSMKGISERLLCIVCCNIVRTSSGFNRNLLLKGSKEEFKKEDVMLKKQQKAIPLSTEKPMLISNNYFNIVKQMENLDYVNSKTSNISVNKIKESLSQMNTIFVKKWVDYSSKYGLGYLLSDGTTGIYFNDSSKIVVDSKNEKIDYISKAGSKAAQLLSFSARQIPNDRQLSKKVTLMQYFRKYLNGSSSVLPVQQKRSSNPPFCYVKKWLKTEDGIIFRLNNKLIQANFADKSQLVIYAESSIMVFTGANQGSKSFYQLGVTDIPKSSETHRKLQIVKSMLTRLNSSEKMETSEFVNNEEEDLLVCME